ncbi:MAG: hypothetical protein NT031_02235 [Planctomycetota bacterium]|nr:hypothetical protein [Planctomycetota bacterium]
MRRGRAKVLAMAARLAAAGVFPNSGPGPGVCWDQGRQRYGEWGQPLTPGGQTVATSTSPRLYLWSPVLSDTLILRQRTSADAPWVALIVQDKDHNVTAMTDTSGAIASWIVAGKTVEARYSYDVFGQVMDSRGSLAAPSDLADQDCQFLYHAGRLDRVTGMYSWAGRDYDPFNGRTLEPNPGDAFVWGTRYDMEHESGYILIQQMQDEVQSLLGALRGLQYAKAGVRIGGTVACGLVGGVGGMVLGSAVFSALDRAFGGQNAGQVILGGISDGFGWSGIYGGIYNEDVMTGKALGWSTGERWFNGIMGATIMVTAAYSTARATLNTIQGLRAAAAEIAPMAGTTNVYGSSAGWSGWETSLAPGQSAGWSEVIGTYSGAGISDAGVAAALRASVASEIIGFGSANMLAAEAEAAVEARGGVYVLRDAETGQVMRTGRTCDLVRREAEHARDPLLRNYDFEAVYPTDVYTEQRGLEQILHDTYNAPLDRIRAISLRNPNLENYLEAARRYLGQ